MRSLRANLSDLQAYPQLTEMVGGPGPLSPSAPGSGGLAELVGGTLRDVLAWRPRDGDPRGFVAALNQAITVRDVDGHTEWQWTPRSYAIQADMGAVTGAQASLYARARAALDQSIPLLEGLYPLRADADMQDVEAVRSLVKAALNELVGELGQVGGPRLQRVQSHFITLLGPDLREEDPEQVQGLLGQLRYQFGMERRRVNTIAEEQNLTNYLIMVDHVIGLERSWYKQHHFFNRQGQDVYLGTQLVLLARALGVVAEATQEVRDALDSVYIRAAERQIVKLNLQLKNMPGFLITIGELLDWIETVATDEGPRSINEGGKDGVITSLKPVLRQLHELTQQMLAISSSKSRRVETQNHNIPDGFFTPRVQVALSGLEAGLNEARDLSDEILRSPRPRIDEVEPGQLLADKSERLYIEGENFQPGARVSFRSLDPQNKAQIKVGRVHLISSTALRVPVNIPSNAGGKWLLEVINPDDGIGEWEFDIGPATGEAQPAAQLSPAPTPTTPPVTAPPAAPAAAPATPPAPASSLAATPASLVSRAELAQDGTPLRSFSTVTNSIVLDAPGPFNSIVIHFRQDIDPASVSANNFRVYGSGAQQVGTNSLSAQPRRLSIKLDVPTRAGYVRRVVLDGAAAQPIRMADGSPLAGGTLEFTIKTP
jgi:hypothetical protein